MGFDPMTHQPRTDIFASLPHLVALLNLKDLLDRHPLDEHAMRLQAEAIQLAKLQYLRYLLQSATSITSNSYTQNGTTDMEILSLLSQIPVMKETPLLNSSQLENINPASSNPFGIATSQPLHYSNLLPQLSDPQVPFNCQPSLNNEMGQAATLSAMLNDGDNSNPSDSSWVLRSPTPSIPPTVTDTSISNNLGDASSTSSYGGGTSSYWPEFFLDDSIMHQIS